MASSDVYGDMKYILPKIDEKPGRNICFWLLNGYVDHRFVIDYWLELIL
jgi:hypothetical protein